jgi:hypothetical protein
MLGRACLHALARSLDSDRSAAGLAAELPYLGVAQGEAKVRQALRVGSPFTEVWRGRWQVGHAAPILRRYLAIKAAKTGPAGNPWGEQPVRDVLDITAMALGLAGEQTRALGAVLALPPRTSFACEVVARAAIEAASLAYWLTEDGIGVRPRVARSMVYRMNGAARMEEALDDMGGPRPGEQRGDYGELMADVQQDAAAHGLSLLKVSGRWKCDLETFPRVPGPRGRPERRFLPDPQRSVPDALRGGSRRALGAVARPRAASGGRGRASARPVSARLDATGRA